MSTVATRLRATGARGFLPGQLPSLQAWLPADAITGLADGAAVATWPDASGNAQNATQGTAGLRPVYKTGIVNGRPVVRADGSQWIATAGLGASPAQPVTLTAVFKLSTTPASLQLLSTGAGNAPAVWNNAGNWALWAGGAVTSATALDTNWHVLTAIFDGASSFIFQDGTQIATGNASTTAPALLTLFADGGGNNRVTGDIAETLVYSQSLSTGDRHSVERWLGAKYAVTVA